MNNTPPTDTEVHEFLVSLGSDLNQVRQRLQDHLRCYGITSNRNYLLLLGAFHKLNDASAELDSHQAALEFEQPSS